MRSFPHQHRRQHSSAQDTSGQGYSPDRSSRGQKGLGSRLPTDHVTSHGMIKLETTEASVLLCAYQCYAPLPPVRAIVGQGGDLINLHINCPNIRDIPNNQIPLQKVGDYCGFDTRSVTVQYTETVAVLKVSSEVIKCPTIGAASFGQSPYVARLLPVRGVVGHNIDRCIMPIPDLSQLQKHCSSNQIAL